MIIVLAGRPSLRTLEGIRELAPGDVVACPVGRQGAHRGHPVSPSGMSVRVSQTVAGSAAISIWSAAYTGASRSACTGGSSFLFGA
jgi:hypothetical protein